MCSRTLWNDLGTRCWAANHLIQAWNTVSSLSTSKSSLEMISISFASVIVTNSSPSMISWKCLRTKVFALMHQIYARMNYRILPATNSDIFSNKWDGALSWASDNGDHTKCPNAAPGERPQNEHFLQSLVYFVKTCAFFL